MLTELLGKGGCVCQPAREGKIQCPLIVRPTSEDVITGHLFGVLRVLNPHWWLPDLLNRAVGARRFRRQYFRKFDISLWSNRPYFPRELLPWREGSTQVDATLTWENPPTTVLCEAKYGSDFSPRTSRDSGEHGYSSDQLIRNIRVGLWECGYFKLERLFQPDRRDLVVIAIAPKSGHPLVAKYRDPKKLRAAIPARCRITQLPRLPFVGELSYADLVHILRQQRCWFSRPERIMVDLLTDYLEYKQATRPGEVIPELPRLEFD